MGDTNFLSPDGKIVEDNWQLYLDKIKGPTNYLDDNELKIDATSGTATYSCTSPHFFGYHFTSSADGVNFIPGGTPVPDPVLHDLKNGVVMGLDPRMPSGNGQQTLGDVLEAFGIKALEATLNSTLKKILDLLEDTTVMSVVHDRSNADGIPTRDGFWLFPTDGTTLEVSWLFYLLVTGTPSGCTRLQTGERCLRGIDHASIRGLPCNPTQPSSNFFEKLVKRPGTQNMLQSFSPQSQN